MPNLTETLNDIQSSLTMGMEGKVTSLAQFDHENKTVAMTRYRTVLDYGYGDKSWTNRMLTLRQVVEFYKEMGWDIDQIRDAFCDYGHLHYWEVDKESDELDSDFLNS